jgi:hypothetical protein
LYKVLCYHPCKAEELGKSIIKLAKKELKKEQQQNVQEALGPVKFGVMPVIQLPTCLATLSAKPKSAPIICESRESPAAKSPSSDKEKQQRGGVANKPDVNDAVKDEWQLTKGKTYKDSQSDSKKTLSTGRLYPITTNPKEPRMPKCACVFKLLESVPLGVASLTYHPPNCPKMWPAT